MTPDLLFLFGNFGLAALLALGGVIALVCGYWLFRGRSGRHPDGSTIKTEKIRIKFGTVGAWAMLTAWVWGVLAWQVAPTKIEKRKDEVLISKEIPERQEVFVSVSDPTRYLECRKERDFSCKPSSIKPGSQCGVPLQPPPVEDGLGRLLVAVARNETSSAQEETIVNFKKQLQLVLAKRRAGDWSKRLMVYRALEDDKPITRLVFNSVPPELVKPMCSWLACEGWTQGPCMLVPRPERPEELIQEPGVDGGR